MRRPAPNEAVVYFVNATRTALTQLSEGCNYERLVELDPAASVIAHCNRALVFIYLGQLEEATRELDLAQAIEPDNPLAQTFRSLALYYKGEAASATDLMRRVLEDHPDMHGVRPILAMCLSAQGHHDEARAQLTDQVKQNAAVDPDIAYELASVYALEGMKDEAFEWLEKAIALGNENRTPFQHDPNLSSLRDDPAFKSCWQKLEASHREQPRSDSCMAALRTKDQELLSLRV